MSRTIRMTNPADPSLDVSSPARPAARWVDLGEIRRHDGRVKQFDSYLRKLLGDSMVFQPGELDEVSRRVARRHVPVVREPSRAEAVRLLEPWCDGSIQNMFDASVVVERGMDWTLAWPVGSATPTVFQGWVDFLLRDEFGIWTVLNVSGFGGSELAERLRLKLSARAAEALGMGPVTQAWRISLGSLEPAEGDCDFSDQAIDALIKEVL